MALSLWERTNLSLLINLVGKGFISLPLSDIKNSDVWTTGRDGKYGLVLQSCNQRFSIHKRGII